MKYPLFVAALLALSISACDKKESASPPANSMPVIPAEQTPAPVEDVSPPPAMEQPAVDAAPLAPPAEGIPPAQEPPAAPADTK